MSVCLAVTKTIAISSLGLYAGLLGTSALALSSPATAVILGGLDVVSASELNRLANRLATTSGVLATISTLSFAVSYFGLPKVWQHPYLLYGMAIPPLVTTYLCLYRASWRRQELLDEAAGGNDASEKQAIEMQDVDGSPVDLGAQDSTASAQSAESSVISSVFAKNLGRVACHLAGGAFLATLAFAQSVVGVYGEGQF
ncbi:Atg33 protein [Maudiozyma humilis]|uniref:Atg33 protein n=1 Tax=Maudiozyma humilis TaxID=51915 RepID=A0AAV5S262_MAUHU|nr:Atg33 protein [Kazachstania humilis]